MIKKWIFVVLTLIFLTADCGDSKLGIFNMGSPDVIIPPTTKVLSTYTMQKLISQDGNTYNFSITSTTAKKLVPGDVIVSGQGMGFLRKVVDVKIEGDQVAVDTTRATLTDAIEKGSFELNTQLLPQNIVSYTMLRGVSFIPYNMNPKSTNLNGNLGDTFDISLNTVIYKDPNNPACEIKANGDVQLQLNMGLGVTVDNWTLQEVKFVQTTSENMSFTVSGACNFNLFGPYQTPPLATVNLSPITVMVGPVPVIVTPEILLSAKLSGSCGGSFTTGVKQSASYSFGLDYLNGNWNPIASVSNNWGISPPTLNANCSIKASLEPELVTLIYGTIGPTASVDGYLRLGANLISDPWWTLYAGIDANVGVDATVGVNVPLVGSVNILDVSFQMPVFNQEWPLASATQPPPPIAPILLTVNPGNIEATLSWSSVNNAASYNIYNSTVSGGPYTLVGFTTSTNDVITGLTDGTTYYFVVTSVNNSGESQYSNEMSVMPQMSLPSAPTNLIATPSSGQVTLTWSPVSGVTGYKVYKSTSSNISSFTLVNSTTITSYTVPGLTNGTTYYFVVTAVNSAGQSNASNEAYATPAAPLTAPAPPTGLVANAGNTQVSLTWNASAGATSYEVYEATTNGGPYSSVNVTSNTNYTVTGLTNGTTYYFVVRAINSVGTSSNSTQANATPAVPPPSAPTGVAASGGNGQVQINWNSVSGATSYNIYWSTASGVTPQNGTKIANVTSPYTQTGLTNGTIYYYVVTAVNSSGESAASTPQAQATPSSGSTLPSAPTGVAASGGNGQVQINWNSVSGATSYNIYWSTASGVTPQNGTKIANVTSPYTQTGLTNGTIYYYVVTAVNSSGESAASTPQAQATPSSGGSVVTHTYSVGTGPRGIAIDSSGNIWVTNNGSNTVTKLSSSGSTLGTYPVGTYPVGISIDSAGNVWVANGNSNTVTKLSSSGSILGTYPAGTAPRGILIDTSGNVWVTDHISSGTVTKLSSSGSILGTYPVGNTPFGIAINTSGNVWVANWGSINVTELNSSGSTIGTYPVGGNPLGTAIDAYGNVWLTNSAGAAVLKLNSSGSTIGTYPVGSNPQGIAIDASGNVWVANGGSGSGTTINKLSSSGSIIGTYTVGTNPQGIVIDASGNVWVANKGSNSVTEIVGVATGPQYFPYGGPQFPGGGNW